MKTMRRPFWTREQMKKHKGRFVRIYRELIESGEWAELPKSSRKVFPILGIFAGEKNRLCYATKRKIMKLSGYSSKKVFNEGLIALEKAGLIEIVNEGGKENYRLLDQRFKKMDAKFYDIESEYFFGGLWAILKAATTSVYVVLGVYSNPADLLKEYEMPSLYGEHDGHEPYLPQGDYRYTKITLDEIADLAGVSKASAIKAIRILCICQLVYPRKRLNDQGKKLSNIYFIARISDSVRETYFFEELNDYHPSGLKGCPWVERSEEQQEEQFELIEV